MSEGRPPSWVRDLLGLPFALGADGPEAYDCWGIVREALRARWSVPVPAYGNLRGREASEQLAEALDADPGAWIAVDPQHVRDGDVLEFLGREDGIHVGIVVADGWMLHARRGGSTCLDRYRRAPWSGMIVGAHRHRAVNP